MHNVKHWTTQDLIIEAKSLYALIYDEQCYNGKDMMLLEYILDELEQRGLSVQEKGRLIIT